MSTITLGLDLGDRSSRYAVLDADASFLSNDSISATGACRSRRRSKS